MSDATTGLTSADTGVTTELITTDPAPPADGHHRVKADDLPEGALVARLARERETAQRHLLSELGVADVSNAKAALAELKRRQDSEKTELERLQSEVESLRATASKADAYLSVISDRAAVELGTLPDQQREAVTRLAGDDPAKQLSAIEHLRAAGMLATITPPGALAAPVIQQPSAPTAPRAPAPPPNGGPPSDNPRDRLEALQRTNPMAAAEFLLANISRIYPQ